MDNILKDLIMKPLSDEELISLVDHKARLVTHDQIGSFRDIDDLLGPDGACIILYVLRIMDDGADSLNGHWCCLFKSEWGDDCISYFDSYGNRPDDPLNYISPEAKARFGDKPILSRMLKDDGRMVVYNNAKLQHKDQGINVCGRMCALRLNMRDIDGYEFADIMTTFDKKGLPSDVLSSILTCWA